MQIKSVKDLIDKAERLEAILPEGFKLVSVGVSLVEYRKFFRKSDLTSVKINGREVQLDVSTNVRRVTFVVGDFK